MREKEDLLDSNTPILAKRATSVAEQVAFDLAQHLSRLPNIAKALEPLSKKIGIPEVILKRICAMESDLNYIAVFKIYRYLLNEFDDAKLVQLCPPLVQNFFKEVLVLHDFTEGNSYLPEAENELMHNQVALELVVVVSTGPMCKEEIHHRFGTYGVDVAKKLVIKKYLQEHEPSVFSLGPVRINMSPDTIVKTGLQIISTYAKPEKGYERGQLCHGFYSQGLTPEVYAEWLKIDREAFEKKVQLAMKAESRGPKRAYTFISTDTLEKRERS